MIRDQRPGEAVDSGLFTENLKGLDEIPVVIVVHKYVTTLDASNETC